MASELLLSGRFFSASEAQQWGLLNQVTEDGEALDNAMAIARQISKNSQGSIRAIKRLAKEEGHVERVDRAVAIEMQLFAELLQTEETQLRIKQVLSKQ